MAVEGGGGGKGGGEPLLESRGKNSRRAREHCDRLTLEGGRALVRKAKGARHCG